MDMHSGGGQKLDWPYIYIEAPEEEAKSVFYSRFDRNPDRVSCTCCGEDYSITESKTLEEVTAFERGCKYDEKAKKYIEEPDTRYSFSSKHTPLKEYLKHVKVIYAKDIKPEERHKDVPEEGFVWQ